MGVLLGVQQKSPAKAKVPERGVVRISENDLRLSQSFAAMM
jgi:hypothetical protein